ncbi:hypothetical protein Tco_0098097 [Tanacetum coccineum]
MDFSEESVEKSWGKESANEIGSEFISLFDSSFVEFVQSCFCFSNSEEFVNVLMRIGFGSTIKLVSFDESQVVTFNGKFVCGFRNSERGTGSQSDNTVDSWYRIFTKRQKQSQTGQNRARIWREREKLRPRVQKD